MDSIDTIYEEGRAAAVAALEAAAERLRLRLAELEVEISELQDGQPTADPPLVDDTAADDPVVEWLAGVYREAKAVYSGPRWRQGRKGHEAAQLAAMAAFRARFDLSFREAHARFVADAALRRALEVGQMPSASSIRRAALVMEPAAPAAEPPEPAGEMPPWEQDFYASNTYEGVARSTAPPALDDETVTVSPLLQDLQPNPMQAGADAALARHEARPRPRSGETMPINPMRLAASEPAWAAKSEVHR